MMKLFPLTSTAKKDLAHLIAVVIAYLFIGVVVGIISKLLSWIPLVNLLVGLVSWLIRTYCVVGLVYAILVYFNVVK